MSMNTYIIENQEIVLRLPRSSHRIEILDGDNIVHSRRVHGLHGQGLLLHEISIYYSVRYDVSTKQKCNKLGGPSCHESTSDVRLVDHHLLA